MKMNVSDFIIEMHWTDFIIEIRYRNILQYYYMSININVQLVGCFGFMAC